MKRLAMVCLVFFMVVAVPGCSKESEEEKVGKVITDVQAAAEEKDVKKIINHLADTYNDPQGFDRDAVRRVLLGYFLGHPKITAYITYLKISVDGPSARAAFQTVLTSGKKTGSPTDVIPESLGVYRFDVSLEKESGGWKVTSARWERIGDGE
ncbi:MAG: nuclear transport factor 2 family protein [Syntrophorhabdaceae bacterium]|nr:nuclear transport factor 2 family protein [Syntrophorhabdaceae bacterium]